MNAFDRASLVEARGMALLLPWLEERAENGRYVLTSKGRLARHVQATIGDLVMNPKGQRDTLWAVEIKIEQANSANLFLETWSNRNLEDRASHAERGMNPGWMVHQRADVLLYYMLDPDRLFICDLFKIKRWAFGGSSGDGRIYQYPEKPQSKYQQKNDTWGRCVPIATLIRDCGVRETSIRQMRLDGDIAL